MGIELSKDGIIVWAYINGHRSRNVHPFAP